MGGECRCPIVSLNTILEEGTRQGHCKDVFTTLLSCWCNSSCHTSKHLHCRTYNTPHMHTTLNSQPCVHQILYFARIHSFGHFRPESMCYLVPNEGSLGPSRLLLMESTVYCRWAWTFYTESRKTKREMEGASHCRCLSWREKGREKSKKTIFLWVDEEPPRTWAIDLREKETECEEGGFPLAVCIFVYKICKLPCLS